MANHPNRSRLRAVTLTPGEARTKIEAGYEAQGYKLPLGYTWKHVAAQRAEFGIGEIYVPVATGGGACAWGVPMIDGHFLTHEA